MNTSMMLSVAPRIYPQWQKVCSLQYVTANSAKVFETAGTKNKSVSAPTGVTALLILPDFVLPSEIEAPKRSGQAMLHQAEAEEKLICEAETALASQTACTYRQWYSHWRRCGIRVNDLLDMTWVWRQRARIL